MKNLIVPSLFIFLFFSCSKTEYVDVDVDPQLEILITDISSTSVSGVTVKLYATESDFRKDENVLGVELTGSDGKVLFEDLSESIYYFYASKAGLSNFYEVVTFETPLKKNEIRVVKSIIR